MKSKKNLTYHHIFACCKGNCCFDDYDDDDDDDDNDDVNNGLGLKLATPSLIIKLAKTTQTCFIIEISP